MRIGSLKGKGADRRSQLYNQVDMHTDATEKTYEKAILFEYCLDGTEFAFYALPDSSHCRKDWRTQEKNHAKTDEDVGFDESALVAES